MFSHYHVVQFVIKQYYLIARSAPAGQLMVKNNKTHQHVTTIDNELSYVLKVEYTRVELACYRRRTDDYVLSLIP